MRSVVMAPAPALPCHIDSHSIRVSATTPLSQVMGSLQPNDCVLVVDQEQVIGLITERDSVRLAAHRESWSQLRAGEVMTAPIRTVPYPAVKDLDRALTVLQQQQTTHLGVISETGEWLGLLSSASIRRALQISTSAPGPDRSVELDQDRFFNLSLDMLCIAGLDGYFRRINPAFERVLGYSQTELLSQTFLNFVHPADQESTLAAIQTLSQGQNLTSFENRYRCHDGSYKWILWSSVPYLEEKLIYAVARDITEKKRVEEELRLQALSQSQLLHHLEERVEQRTQELSEANQRLQGQIQERLSIETQLRENEAKLAGILDTADEAIISINEQQIIQIFNQGAERIFGYTAEEVLGQPLSILIPDAYHAIHQGHVVNFQGKTSTSRQMVGSRGEVWGRRKTGEIFPAEASISRLVTREGLLFTSILQDATDRRRAEQALQRNQGLLQKIIDNSPAVIAVMDLNHEHLLVNRSYADLVGTPQDRIVGRSVKDFWPPEVAASLIENNQKILSSNMPLQVEEILPHAEGPHTYISSIFPLQAERGELYAICSISTDISDRKAIEQMKDEFISVVSHELRTPLTSIHGSLKLLASGHFGQTTPEGQEVLEIAAASTQRLIRLVSDVLDLERMQDRQFTLRKVICDGEQLLIQATEMLRALANQQGITLEVRPSPVHLWAVPDLILQTLTNLLSNAIKFSPDHTTISLQAISGETEVTVRIQDQGQGIPADQLETIFERFQQVDASDSRSKGGTGLGLAICRNIIEKHGGRIWAESRLREGSTFYFTLPKAPELTEEGR